MPTVGICISGTYSLLYRILRSIPSRLLPANYVQKTTYSIGWDRPTSSMFSDSAQTPIQDLPPDQILVCIYICTYIYTCIAIAITVAIALAYAVAVAAAVALANAIAVAIAITLLLLVLLHH